MNSRTTLLFGAAAYLALGIPDALADEKVGDTKDACDKHDVVSFKAKPGTVKVKAGETKTFEMDGPRKHITWYCGNEQEEANNDVLWDKVRLKRASNGALSWTFYRMTTPGGSDPSGPSSPAGNTSDGCDKSHLVMVHGKSGDVKVAAGQKKTIDLASPVKELAWKCGSSDERVANDTAFDRVELTRRDNGAVKWAFALRTQNEDPPEVCPKIRAKGRLVYKNPDGNYVPLARAKVKLMDEDFGPHDQTMAVGITDADGRFDLAGTADDSGWPDPYVEFIMFENHRVDVRDPFGNSARSYTPTLPESCGVVDFGEQRWEAAELNPILYARGQRAYQRWQDRTSDTRVPKNDGIVEVEYPTVLIWNTPYTTLTTIHWQWHGENKVDYDALDHEFGHRLRHAADGGETHFNWDATRFTYARNHSSTDKTNEGFAFNEGWAIYHKWAINRDAPTTASGSVALSADTGDDEVEGDVAEHLKALHNACGGLKKLWGAMRDAGPDKFHSIDEYRSVFLARNPTCKMPGATGSSSSPLKRRITKPAVAPKPSGAAPRGVQELERMVTAGVTRPTRSAIHPDARLTADARKEIDALAKRQVERDGALHDATVAAYTKALKLLELPPEALGDGSYAKQLALAKAQLVKDVRAARERHRRDSDKDVESMRKSTKSRHVTRYLDGLRSDVARAKRGDDELDLPKSFWPTTRKVK